jgi:peptide/nickel transport system permease protein
MVRFLLIRLAIIPPALILINFLGYGYAHLVKPVRAFRNPYVAATIDSEPVISSYSAYFQSALQNDFGTIVNPWGTHGTLPIGRVILEASLASLGLLIAALSLSIVVGTAFGFWAAKTEPPSITRWLTSFSTLGLAMPTFFIGGLFFAFWFLYVLWGGPGTIPLPISGFGWDSHLIIPTLVLMIRPTVQIAQVTAGQLTDEFGKQYIVASRSRGQRWPVIRRRDAFRNILVPVIMTIAASVRILVGELIVVEWLFNWPGLGNLLAQTLIPAGTAFTRGLAEGGLFLDPPLVAIVLTIFAFLFIVTDLTASILVRVFDPRLRG